jgi:hypothetical protein
MFIQEATKMVKRKSKEDAAKKQAKKARRQARKNKRRRISESRSLRIGPNTKHDVCSEQMTAFGGLLALVKFLDLIKFKDVFKDIYVSPPRKPILGCYRMVLGLLIMLFVGFQRIGHIKYLREDSMITGILKVPVLPAVSTFWRYLQSLKIVQSQSLLRLMAALRARVWQLVGYRPRRVRVNIDTTVATVYGDIQGACKGHNTKHRGKKGLRPVLCFLDQTREYLCGAQRRGQTITGKEVAQQIHNFRRYLPDYVEEILACGDGEFISWESVCECEKSGFSYIFGNRSCTPPFSDKRWYRHGEYEYNECMYQPTGWGKACRFVVMRIRKDQKGERELPLFEEDNYVYRVFVTNLSLKPHNVIAVYDKRADVENSIGEAQREGILAIPSKKFQSNHAYFQIVMLAYNLWRWLKQVAGHHEKTTAVTETGQAPGRLEVVDQTVRLSRLKMLYVAAKISQHSNRATVYYSIHESRASGIIKFLDYLDRRRAGKIPKFEHSGTSTYRATG